MILGDVAAVVGKGIFVGLAGTTAMTLSQQVEMKFSGREPSTGPGDMVADLPAYAAGKRSPRIPRSSWGWTSGYTMRWRRAPTVADEIGGGRPGHRAVRRRSLPLGHNAFRLRDVGSASVPRLVVAAFSCTLIPVALGVPQARHILPEFCERLRDPHIVVDSALLEVLHPRRV